MVYWLKLVQINALYFGLNTLNITNGFVLPLLVQKIVGESQQGARFGQVRLWSLMIAILSQSLVGILSDRTTLRWGRRRPYILGGSLFTLVFLSIVGRSSLLSGEGSFAILLLMIILVQVAYNTANAGQNGLIPDLVPEGQRGIASGVKALLEVPLPLLVVAVLLGPLISKGALWQAILIGMLILLLTTILALTVKERLPQQPKEPVAWQPFIRLALMTVFFAAVILLLGEVVRQGAHWPEGQIRARLQPVPLGILGLISIVLALMAGAWISLRIGLGKTALRANPAYARWMLHRLAFLTGLVNMGVFSIYFIQSRLGITGELAAGPGAFFLALLGVIISLVTLPSGWLADRYGKRQMAALGCLVAALGTLVLLLTANMALMMVGGSLIGVGAGITLASSWALGTELAPAEKAGEYLGLQTLASAGAGAVGAYIGGPIADYFSRYFPSLPGVGYVVLYAMFGLLFLLSAALLWGKISLTLTPTPSPSLGEGS